MTNGLLWIKGGFLPAKIQKEVLAAYVHRFTGEHKPQWANSPRPDGSPYPVQFADDKDWLANTLFCVKTDNTPDKRVRRCESTPTWPHNPELRKKSA